ncbi:coagulation factor XI-like isoform X2 [Gambusia affinis]|uniref:coagulation factor XI-like isoform X2 n=1 Tax=Gambusia affinis TaxID=33528 RepID=UPI000F343C31|nr:coagulation factor XI-like isoform X2 [Gambusia affinis]
MSCHPVQLNKKKMESCFLRVFLLLLVCLSSSQGCIQGFLQNVDFLGSDVVDTYSPSMEHCQELCTQHPSCLFFTFNRPDKSSGRFRCYLKSSSSGHPQAQILLMGVNSGYSLKPCNLEPRTCFPQVFEDADFHGGDYKTFFTVNFEECQRVCTLDPVCQFFTFITGNFSSPEVRYKCHLKFSWYVPRPTAVVLKTGVVSGFSQKPQLTQYFATVCRSHLFSNTDFRGNDFLESEAVSPEHCQFLCSVHPQCTYFSFSSNDFRCLLKNNPNSMVAKTKSNFTSGISSHLCQIDESWAKLTYEDIEFHGSDFRSEVVTSVDICQEKCTEDPNCQFYTYHNGSFIHPDQQHRCFMKRVITMPMPSQVKKVDNVMSGFTLRNCRSV